LVDIQYLSAQEERPLLNTEKLHLIKMSKEILYPCFIETNVDSSDIVLCIFLGFSISLILVVKKTSTADDRLLQKFSMDLSDVKLETVLKSKLTSLTSLINSIFKKKINTVDSRPYFIIIRGKKR